MPEDLGARYVEGWTEEGLRNMPQRIPKRTFESAQAELEEMLQKEDPKIITSDYISKNNGLYQFLIRHYSKMGKKIDWDEIFSGVDEKFRNRFKEIKSKDKDFPKETYIDEKEVGEILNKYSEKLYTFVKLLEESDLETRNFICAELSLLAKKGNNIAKEKLMELLEPTVEMWIEKNPDFIAYAYDSELLYNMKEKCVYYYDASRGDSFTGYLYASLAKKALALKGKILIGYYDGNRSNYVSK